jgi:hypothetical protein
MPDKSGSIPRVQSTLRVLGVLCGVCGICSLAIPRPVLAGGDCVFVRGELNNLNGRNVVDFNDAVDILAYLFLGVSVPPCLDAADVNDNGIVELSDYTYLVNFLANGGPPPPAPFPDPGVDPTPGVISVPAERDSRFRFSIGSGMGVPSNTGIHIPVRMSNEVGVTGLQVVLEYNTRDAECPDLLIQEIRTEEQTLLSGESADYIIAEFDNRAGMAYIASLKDFATPFWFHTGSDPNFRAGTDQLVGTIVLGISRCADQGFSPITFVDGRPLPNNRQPQVALPPMHNLVMLGDSAVRPLLDHEGAGVDIRRGFIRGDANKDDGVDISDSVFILNYLFQNGREPPCLDAADANNDTRIDISDAIWMLNYLFHGGPQPSEPFPQAGVDPSDDGRGSLGCLADR